MIQIFCILLASVQVYSQLSLFVNNNSSTSTQNGTFDFPYTSFSSDIIQNISSNLNQTAVTVYFIPTGNTYQFNFNDTDFIGVNISYSLTFTTYLPNEENNICGSFAELIIGATFPIISADNLNLVFDKIVLENMPTISGTPVITIYVTEDMVFEITNSCIMFNSIPANVFVVTSQGSGFVNVSNVNLTNQVDISATSPFLAVKSNKGLECVVDSVILEDLTKSAEFNFVDFQTGSDKNNYLTQANLTNILLLRDQSVETETENTIFLLKGFTNLVIENITIQYFSFQTEFFNMVEVTNLNISNIYVTEQFCGFCVLFVVAGGPAIGNFSNITFNGTYGLMLVYLFESNIEFFLVENFNFINSELQSENSPISLFDYNLITNNPGGLIPLMHNNINIQNSLLGGIIYAAPKGEIAKKMIADYQVVFNNLNVAGVVFNDSNTLLMIDYYQLVLTNSSFDNVVITDTFFAYSSQNGDSGNYLLQNVTFANMLLNPACLFDTNLQGGVTQGNNLDYRLLAISESTFTNITTIGGIYMMNNEYPFSILINNIFHNISGDTIQLLSISQATTPNQTNRNIEIENKIFALVPSFIQVFDYMCGNGSLFCNGGCYFNNIVGNIFSEINFFDPSDNSYFYFFNTITYDIVNVIQNNIYINMISNGYIYSIPSFSIKFYISGEIRSNVAVGQDIFVIMGVQNLTVTQNTYYQLMTPALILYQNLTVIPNYNLTYPVPIIISENIYFDCYSGPAFSLQLQYVGEVAIQNNYFGKFFIFTNDYSAINFIELTASNSEVDISLDSNTFWNITMLNNFTQKGFYPPQMNSLIQARLLTGVNLTIVNTNFELVNQTMMLSNLMDLQAQKISLANLSFNKVTLRNTQGYAFHLITPYLRVSNIVFTKFSLEAYSNYLGTRGIIQLSYVDVYYASKTNLVFFQNLSITDWVGGSVLNAQGTYFNMNVSNSQFNNISQVFVMSASGGYLLFENISYTSDIGKFLTTSQKHSVSSTIIIKNYTQVTQSNPGLKGAFDLDWHDLQFIASDIYVSNLDLVSTGKFVGLINVSNLSYGGHLNNGMTLKPDEGESSIILKNLSANNIESFALMSIETHGKFTAEISKICLYSANVSNAFNFKVSNISKADIHLSEIVVFDSKGVEFTKVNVKENGTCSISLNNSIFNNGGFPILSAEASLLKVNNVIQVNDRDLEPISDKGTINQTTELSNITIHNTLSSNYWLNAGNKTISINSIVLTSSVNGIKVTNGSILSITNSIFSGNKNLREGGGCINSQASDVKLTNSTMINNSAPYGGVIFQNMSESLGGLALENCIIANNTASYYGPSQSSQAWRMAMNTSLPSNLNETLLAYSYTSFYEVTSNFQQSQYLLTNASLTASQYTHILLYLYDYFGQPITFGKNLPVEFILENGQVNTVMYTTNDSLQTYFKFPASELPFPSANSYSNITIVAKIQGMRIEMILDINARECLPGEVIDDVTGFCTRCPATSYSINPSDSCQSCPEGGTCLGGQFINVAENWWRKPDSGDIYQCLGDGISRCSGGLNPYNQCYTGFAGALCLGCDYSLNYSQSSVNRCKVCSDDVLGMWLKNVGVFLAGYLYEIVFIILAYVSNSTFVTKVIQKSGDSDNYYQSDAYIQSVKFFLFTNYLHIILLIVTYVSYIDTGLVVIMDKAELLVAISSSSITQNSDFSCWLKSMGFAAENLTYAQVVFVTVFPIFKIALTCLLLFLMSQCRRVDHRRTKISIIIISFISLDQNYLLQVLSQLRSCIIGEVAGYSQLNPNISCTDPTYMSFVDSYVIPNMIFWGIGIPLIFFILLFTFKNRLRERKIRFMMGGLMNNFDDRAFYWGLVILLLKQGLLIIFTLVSDSRDATILGIVLLGVYSYSAGKVKPYHSQHLNRVDKYSAFAVYITLIMFNQAIGNENNFIMGLYIIGIFVIYAGIIGYLGFLALAGVYQDVKKINWREWLSSRRKKSEMRVSLDNSSLRSSTISQLNESIELSESVNKKILPQNI